MYLQATGYFLITILITTFYQKWSSFITGNGSLKQKQKPKPHYISNNMAKHFNPYRSLMIQRDTSELDIKNAFKTLALLHHPDKGGKIEKFQEILSLTTGHFFQ